MKGIPIIIFHKGKQEYLQTSLSQAKKYGNRVILLGDESNKSFDDCEWYDADSYHNSDWKEFLKRYIHMSSNSKDYELFCFERFFVIYEWMMQHKTDSCIHIDSDVLVFTDFGKVSEIEDMDFALCMPELQENYRWTANIGTAYLTISALKSFLEYCLDVYTNNIEKIKVKYQYHQEAHVDGGICDMTLLYLWLRDYQGKVLNWAKWDEGKKWVIDNNYRLSENYQKEEYKLDFIRRGKLVRFKKGIPYYYRLKTGWIQTYTMHMAGGSKILMNGIYRFSRIQYWQYVKRKIKLFLEG